MLVVAEHNVERAKAAFADLNFKVVTGSRYLGGFVGEAAAQASWVEDKASSWAEAVGELAVVAKRFPQTAYAGLQKSLQQEWQFVQRVTPGIGAAFAAIEASIRDRFLPALFGEEKAADPTVRTLSSLPVKAAGLALPDPTTSSAANYTASTVCCTHLVQALRGHTPFRHADHVMVMRCAKHELRAGARQQDEQVLAAELTKLDPKTCRTVERARETGSWLSVTPTAVCGFELSAQEFRDGLRLRYGMLPQKLPEKCDGCGAAFSVNHALNCKCGGLVIRRHDDIVGEARRPDQAGAAPQQGSLRTRNHYQ